MINPAQAVLHMDPSAFVNDLLADAQDKWGDQMYLDNDNMTAEDVDEMELQNELEEVE